MNLLYVALGGAAGAMLRYGVSLAFPAVRPDGDVPFPWATLIVNLLGCLAAGALLPLLISKDPLRLLLLTGLLGGFTTFSAFGLETIRLIHQRDFLAAGLYVVASILGGLLLAALGYVLTMNTTAA